MDNLWETLPDVTSGWKEEASLVHHKTPNAHTHINIELQDGAMVFRGGYCSSLMNLITFLEPTPILAYVYYHTAELRQYVKGFVPQWEMRNDQCDNISAVIKVRSIRAHRDDFSSEYPLSQSRHQD